nr:hypothetical protein [Tanacetum cinerariifolium]
GILDKGTWDVEVRCRDGFGTVGCTRVMLGTKEADLHNRPPPTSDEDTEFAPHVVQITDANDVPIPPVIQFGSNFHVGESFATRDLLASNSDVYAPGLMCCNLNSVHRGV